MKTTEEYPLFPALAEGGAEEAQALIESFKKQLSKAAEQASGELYCDIVPHIESDSWVNYRNDLLAGLRDYRNRTIQGDYDFAQIRQAIYKEYRDELIVDLNQDLVKENDELKRQIEFMRKCQ